MYANYHLKFFRLHIAVTHMLTRPGVADRFIGDVKDIVNKLVKNPPAALEGKVKLLCLFTFYFPY